MNNELFKNFFGDDFVNSYIDENNSNLRMSISVILDICNDFLENSERSETNTKTVKEIKRECCEMLKMAEIRSCMLEATRGETVSTLNVNVYNILREFVNYARPFIRKFTTIRLEKGRKLFINVNVRILFLIMLFHIRRMVNDKAKKILINYSLDEDYVIIRMSYTEHDSNYKFCGLDDNDFMLKYTEEICALLAERISVGVSADGSDTVIRILASDRKEDFSSDKQEYLANEEFNTFSHVLSEFGF